MKSESQNPYFLFDTEQDRQTDQCTNQSIAFVFTSHHHMYLHACIVFFILFYFIIFLFVFRFCSFLVRFRSVPCRFVPGCTSYSVSLRVFFSSLFSFYCVNLARFFFRVLAYLILVLYRLGFMTDR